MPALFCRRSRFDTTHVSTYRVVGRDFSAVPLSLKLVLTNTYCDLQTFKKRTVSLSTLLLPNSRFLGPGIFRELKIRELEV